MKQRISFTLKAAGTLSTTYNMHVLLLASQFKRMDAGSWEADEG